MQLAGPGGAIFVLLNNTLSVTNSGTNSGNFDLGLVAGNGGLANVGVYTFTGAGSSTWIAPHSLPGNYNAATWTSGPIAAGDWTLTVNDSVGGDGGAVGNLSVTYTAVPEPASSALLLSAVSLLAWRRRRA